MTEAITLLAILVLSGASSAVHRETVIKAEPFSLSDVKLLPGLFETADQATAKYLLQIEPDRLLHSFLIHSGLPARAPIYGGWENSGLAGHSLGHYLSACSQQFAATGDDRYRQKVEYVVSELARCQKNRPDGYISAIPDGDKHWAEIRSGEIRSGGFDLNGMWSPWYTHHKVLAGLLDAYRLTHDRQALAVAKKFADWAIWETEPLTPAQWQRMLGCEYGGMNDALAELYGMTGEQKYLDLSRKFYDDRVLKPLSEGQDDLAGKHSNTQIPKIIGLATLYRLTGDETDRKTAEFFWDRIVNHRTYAIGGNSNHEYLGPADELSDQLSSNTCESCNTYNMLKLTRQLFEWDPKASYFDYYERAHFNHMLANQDPDSGMITYFMPLATGFARHYSNPDDDWTCCHGTGMEVHTKHADSVYFHEGLSRLWVTQFIPTELNWKAAGVRLRQDTAFPASGRVSLTIEQGSREFSLDIRHPAWAKASFPIRVNGKVVATSSEPSSFTSVRRKWRAGDKVEFDLPMSLHSEPMPDDPAKIAILYGPIVLSADLGSAGAPAPRTPVLVCGGRPPADWLEKTPGKLEFKTDEVARPYPLTLLPFYAIHHDRYATYFDEFTDAQWNQAEADYRAQEARQRDLEARTIDFFRLGEMQPERDHSLTAERNDVRDANGRGYRTPMAGGWMEFDMKVDRLAPNDLVITYWGNELRRNPQMEILIDGQKLSYTVPAIKANAFQDDILRIPEALTHGKDRVRIRVQAIGTSWAPSFAGARTVRRKPDL